MHTIHESLWLSTVGNPEETWFDFAGVRRPDLIDTREQSNTDVNGPTDLSESSNL